MHYRGEVWRKFYRRLTLPQYDYKCGHCKEGFEVTKPMSECSRDEACPNCGGVARRVYSPLRALWGFVLSDSSHIRGNNDKYVLNKPSNEGEIRL